MKLCEHHNCTEWAQWRVTLPSKVSILLCQKHKDAIKKNDETKFIFMGAVPDGIELTQHRANR